MFLVLAALYESWSLPFSVLLSVPIAVVGAFGGLALRHFDLDVYAQIGLVMLVALSFRTTLEVNVLHDRNPPYVLLSDSLPAAKMGVYMGIFNFFIVIPQLLAASVLGVLLKLFFHGQPVWALALGGASLFVSGLCALRVREPATLEPTVSGSRA